MSEANRSAGIYRPTEANTGRAMNALAVVAVAFLAFLAGSYVMYQKLYPADALRRAFMGGNALYDQFTGYNDPFQTAFWNPARTDGRGVLRRDPTRTQPGLTLYSSGHDHKAFLIDLKGRVAHEWSLPFSRVWDESAAVKKPREDPFIYIEKAHVFPNGDLLALYTAIGDTPWGYGLVKMDRNSNVIWKYLGHAHHDFDIAADGSIYVLTHEIVDTPLPGYPDLATPRIDDYVVKLSADGQEEKKIWLSGAFAQSPFGRRLHFVPWNVHASNGDYLHANSVQVLKKAVPGIPQSRPGQVLVSLREVSTVALADMDSGSVPWAASGSWLRQHAARFLHNGHLILFDNEGGSGGHGLSRVLELDPKTQQLAWSYAGTEGEPLESVTRSSQNRLANGNTLIVESEAGRIIEVTPKGDIVWEFVNPVRDPTSERVPIIFWVDRLAPDKSFTPEFRRQIDRALRAKS
jgi:hypothetical protein